MSKQKRHVLSFDTEVDFEIIGICSHHSDYRLAWGLNQELKLVLAKSDDPFVMQSKKGNILSKHSYHVWQDEENLMEYYLIKNKCESKYLIPEKAQIDFFLFIKDNRLMELEDVLRKVKSVGSVVAAYSFDPSELPSADQIILE